MINFIINGIFETDKIQMLRFFIGLCFRTCTDDICFLLICFRNIQMLRFLIFDLFFNLQEGGRRCSSSLQQLYFPFFWNDDDDDDDDNDDNDDYYDNEEGVGGGDEDVSTLL